MYTWKECKVNQISRASNRPVCYTTEAVRYAQTAYFISAVIFQMTTLLTNRSLKFSLANHGYSNKGVVFGIALSFIMAMLLLYIAPLHYVFGTRDLHWYHIAQGFIFSILMMVLDETRKYLARRKSSLESDESNWYERNALW
eukprot:TRINITY_DN4446_c0_g1_i3.p1 TRINITY_DN4446_c0_g1~~TRINITY_DN4446_c0_g1_i3.p1  ORF type:complete len:142 (+),score=10.00 TRINITY_DN4446_c0_g1_i3:102-527(+)